jgi:hypothetical protein
LGTIRHDNDNRENSFPVGELFQTNRHLPLGNQRAGATFVGTPGTRWVSASAPLEHDAEGGTGLIHRLARKASMSKKPKVDHKYQAGKDKMKITIRGYSPSKKVRTAIIKKVLKQLEASPDHLVAAARKHSKKKPKNPLKQPKLIEIGD